MKRLIALLLLGLLLVHGRPVNAEAIGASGLRKATLALLWQPQAQFAGYLVALEKGIYRRHGIDLAIALGGPGRSPADALRDGHAEFATLWLATALQHRGAGLSVINIAQISQRSSMVLVARKSAGIATVADLADRKISLWGGDLAVAPRAFFDRHRLSVQSVPQSDTVNLFLRGGVQVASAMWYNEYHLILNAGVDADELTVFRLDGDGFNFPEDGLYTLAATIERDPALVDGFVRASLEGWDYAIAHPDEALDIVLARMREANLPANRVHQKWMLAQMAAVIRPGGTGAVTGLLKRNDLAGVVDELQRTELLQAVIGYDEFTRPPYVAP
jgi:NitT/TauT family transport system substrate-binding protein